MWTEAETDFVRTNCTWLSDSKLAARLTELTGKLFTKTQVREMRERLGIGKSAGRNAGVRVRPSVDPAASGQNS
jgi:hypothetical protein